MNIRPKALIAVLLITTGCAKPLEVASISEIKPPPGAGGIDVYAARRAAGEPVPEFAGEQLLEIRSYREPEDSQVAPLEFAGAACQVKASNFTADVVTPAKLRVPLYRNATSPLGVSCQMEGYQPRMVTSGVHNISQQQRYRTGSSVGLIGAAVALAADTLADKSQDEYRYRIIQVQMAPEKRSQNAAQAAAR